MWLIHAIKCGLYMPYMFENLHIKTVRVITIWFISLKISNFILDMNISKIIMNTHWVYSKVVKCKITTK